MKKQKSTLHCRARYNLQYFLLWLSFAVYTVIGLSTVLICGVCGKWPVAWALGLMGAIELLLLTAPYNYRAKHKLDPYPKGTIAYYVMGKGIQARYIFYENGCYYSVRGEAERQLKSDLEEKSIKNRPRRFVVKLDEKYEVHIQLARNCFVFQCIRAIPLPASDKSIIDLLARQPDFGSKDSSALIEDYLSHIVRKATKGHLDDGAERQLKLVRDATVNRESLSIETGYMVAHVTIY